MHGRDDLSGQLSIKMFVLKDGTREMKQVWLAREEHHDDRETSFDPLLVDVHAPPTYQIKSPATHAYQPQVSRPTIIIIVLPNNLQIVKQTGRERLV